MLVPFWRGGTCCENEKETSKSVEQERLIGQFSDDEKT
jgi:hypothetical protein